MESTKSALSYDEVHSIVSTLPRGNGWLSTDDIFLCEYQGFWYYPLVVEKMLSGLGSQLFNLTSSPNTTLLCSSPKSGTTWLKALAFAIATRNRYSATKDNPLLTTLPHHLIPFIEFSPIGDHSEAYDPALPLLSTHLPYTSLPKSIFESKCKIIYICRDPKDVFISRWHFSHKIMPNKDPIPLDEAFDLFCNGVSSFGPYWDHVLGYWKASQDHPRKVLFLKYEDMLMDPVLYFNRVAEFMGYPFSNQEVIQGVPQKIVEMCSFESLKNFEANKKKSNNASQVTDTVLTTDIFFKKGKIGDWSNYLSQEMKTRIDQITVTKFLPYNLEM